MGQQEKQMSKKSLGCYAIFCVVLIVWAADIIAFTQSSDYTAQPLEWVILCVILLYLSPAIIYFAKKAWQFKFISLSLFAIIITSLAGFNIYSNHILKKKIDEAWLGSVTLYVHGGGDASIRSRGLIGWNSVGWEGIDFSNVQVGGCMDVDAVLLSHGSKEKHIPVNICFKNERVDKIKEYMAINKYNDCRGMKDCIYKIP